MGVTSRRQREREARRAKILAAAEDVFVAKGFADATMDEVATRAELSKGTLYLYFKDKDDLYVGTCLLTLRRLVERYEQVTAGDGAPLEVLRELSRAHVEFARENRERFRLAMSWMLSNFTVDPETRSFDTYRKLLQRVFQLVVSTIARGQADGSIRADLEPRTLALQIWGSTLGMLLLSLNRDEIVRRLEQDADFDGLVPSFVDLLLDSIRGTPK